ncbi:NADH-quinone oxidoreductase subunit NuoE [Caldanaerobius polysaccharolyticus]|uniref:NADH-quinone oxidoreductase subunit NuoE n=1 Tax=Caldanaerobius polysaccharolyticus TaxID=44256 RepID=UPI00047CEDEB|nr:NADH-quinone oxidoreductase subunit NuoE [Caldanaerobius polysaccharolyticus]
MPDLLSKNLDPEKVEKLKGIIEYYKDKRGSLIPVMNEAQELFGYLPYEVQEMIAKGLNVPISEVYGVATFYSRFTLKPAGKYKIGVCLGTACYVKGAALVMDKIREKLGIEAGETTSDGKFSLDATRCLGACGLAPVMMINDEVYGRLTPDEVVKIIEKYQNEK